MNGYDLAAEGHPILVLPPVSISGGKTAQAFSMKGANHVSIGVLFGATSSPPVPPTAINVFACTDANGSNPVAIPNFCWYAQATPGAGHDILDNYVQASVAGKVPNFTAGIAGITHASGAIPADVTDLQYWIEINASETNVQNVVGPITDHPYIQVQIVDSGNVTYAAILAVLSGLRYPPSITATV